MGRDIADSEAVNERAISELHGIIIIIIIIIATITDEIQALINE